ncbi:hypothetical protein X798_05642 [Onchocerca flexuosa]|uniref:Uncharacterized protein n=1 Tax=Onchocerca flexuosa TaxID=387005 RepID=A0A238BQ13_9BILA|nr:hypothetical protein X798_05642 [Onchocerca flexuosa]
MYGLLLLEALLVAALIGPINGCMSGCCCPPRQPSCGCGSTCGGGGDNYGGGGASGTYGELPPVLPPAPLPEAAPTKDLQLPLSQPAQVEQSSGMTAEIPSPAPYDEQPPPPQPLPAPAPVPTYAERVGESQQEYQETTGPTEVSNQSGYRNRLRFVKVFKQRLASALNKILDRQVKKTNFNFYTHCQFHPRQMLIKLDRNKNEIKMSIMHYS